MVILNAGDHFKAISLTYVAQLLYSTYSYYSGYSSVASGAS
jgi:hypothetical protein